MFKGREGEWLQKLSTKALFTLSGITCCAFICSHTNTSLSCFISFTKHCSFDCLILDFGINLEKNKNIEKLICFITTR